MTPTMTLGGLPYLIHGPLRSGWNYRVFQSKPTISIDGCSVIVTMVRYRVMITLLSTLGNGNGTHEVMRTNHVIFLLHVYVIVPQKGPNIFSTMERNLLKAYSV